MSLLSIDVARLIHHYLLKEGYENTANLYISECIHLKGLKPVKSPYKLPRLLGPSLVDLLESYFETKDYVIEELELVKCSDFKEQDCLSTLMKVLIERLKSSNAQKCPSRKLIDRSLNTDIEFQKCHKCFSNESLKKKSDVCINTELVLLNGSQIKINKRTRQEQSSVRRIPIAIAPKPTITLTFPDSTNKLTQVSTIEELIPNQTTPDVVGCQMEVAEERVFPTMKPNSVSHTGLSKPKPAMRIKHRLLSKRPRKLLRSGNTCISKPACSSPKPGNDSQPIKVPITPAMAELVKIAQEACKNLEIVESEVQNSFSPPPDVILSTPTANSIDFVTTPTSSRRRSHVRQLNFGETLETTGEQDSLYKNHPNYREIPWDCALRNAIAALPPEKETVFATPNGKAKRVKRKSPQPVSNEATSIQNFTSCPTPSNRLDDIINGNMTPIQNASVIENLNTQTLDSQEYQLKSQHSSRLESITSSCCTDFETASVLTEMANSSMTMVNNKENVEDELKQHPESSHVLLDVENKKEAQPDSLSFGPPVLVTPQKKEVEIPLLSNLLSSNCHDGNSNTSFCVWDGDIPRTPQIRFDLTNSTSPFQISLTKGFRFLPAADSPSLAVPSTPCIIGTINDRNSIDTPCNVIYRFPSTLGTPRLEALRQDKVDSPCSSLNTTMISPTQVVLGRATPYFVPSGERIPRPFVNENATPEHMPEPVKFNRSRHSSSEMDPLQLEESNDALDTADGPMLKSSLGFDSALQQTSMKQDTPSHQLHIATPKKTDETLEKDLISECQRLEDEPSFQKDKQRNQRFIDLFGDDSSSLNTTITDEARIPQSRQRVLNRHKSSGEKSKPEKKRKKLS